MKMPQVAKRIARILRRDVKRPLHIPIYDGDVLHWKRTRKGRGWNCCPMGLHPKALNPNPYSAPDFPIDEVSDKEIVEFADWWDGLYIGESEKAIGAIWPKKKSHKR